ncbi:hypothetical protein Clacol_000629 [Clathrus columnatus]|uniref:General stress protein FMN-binding split barrel domain-containing protein n=1 Tax=Clathrus columnatus TaxID=1419009 RepID=A0AAV4ZWY9_9AGAM|nr:hypothetical protein Clacol_000629 [Clathrus columnatus]
MSTAHAQLEPYTAKAENRDVTPQVKINDLEALVHKVQTAMLTTRSREGQLHSRAMNLAKSGNDDDKNSLRFVFIANNASEKFGEIQNDEHVNLSFYEQSTTNWASVAGKARITQDRNFIKKYWSSLMAGYFNDMKDGIHKGDVDDPRVSAIEIIPIDIKYWIAHRGSVGRTMEVAVGALTGKGSAPGELRTINSEELAPEEETDDAPEQDKEALDDLGMELELADEDELVLYRVGEAFLHLPLNKAQGRLQRDQEAIASEIDRMQEKVEECEKTMKDLKIQLYAKFGKAINLDA